MTENELINFIKGFKNLSMTRPVVEALLMLKTNDTDIINKILDDLFNENSFRTEVYQNAKMVNFYDGDKLVLSTNNKAEVRRFFGVKYVNVSKYIKDGELWKGKYRVEVIM